MTRPGRRRALVAVLAIAALQGVAVLGYREVERRRNVSEPRFTYERLTRGPAMPEVELVRAGAGSLQTSALRDRPVLLHFWATWCKPCREELPELLQLARNERSVRLVAVSLDDDWPAVRAFFAGKVPSEVARDPSGALARAFDVSALPDTFLILRNGTAVLRFAGARAWQSASAREVLEPHFKLLPGPPLLSW